MDTETGEQEPLLKEKSEEASSSEDAHAIKSALEYLYVEAMTADLRLAAFFIGAAAEAIGLRQEQLNTNSKSNGVKR